MEEKFLRYVIVLIFAFVAELIDGGLGMGYGVSLTSLLLSVGVGTAVASASVHMSELFTTFISGVSHFKMGNFNKKIFTYLTVSGVVGGSLGAYLAVIFQDVSAIKPVVSSILLLLGVLIIIKYLKKKDSLEEEYATPRKRHLLPLGFVAAFIDAIGGGGWGPVATPTLIAGNSNPAKTIGSVNFAEFFVTMSISITFFLAMPDIEWTLVVPMIIGGVIAAPTATLIIKKMSPKILGISVGCLIILLSIRTILKAFGVWFPF